VTSKLTITLFDEALSLFDQGDLEAASDRYQKILADNPNNVRALHALAVIAFKHFDIITAVELLLKTLALQPGYHIAWCSLGKIQKNLGLLTAARRSYLKAAGFEGTATETLCALGAVCRELNLLDEALVYLQGAQANAPSNPLVYYELACLHQKAKRFKTALECFDKALSLKPDYAEAYARQSLVYFTQGRVCEANWCLKRCLHLRPESTVAHSLLTFSLNYETGVEPTKIYELSREWARLAKLALKNVPQFHDNVIDPDRPLRLGFVSPDFRRHPVGYFVQSFLMLHDRDDFKVYCYSDVQNEDEITHSLIDCTEQWRRTYGVRDEKVAEMIRRDRIDILVDLTGHTKDNRLNVFLLKPAPIQATWAGYVGTTGLDTIDYLISDGYQSPEGAEAYTIERIYRLPDDYVCFMPPEHAPDVAPLPALHNGYVTFGSFNNLAKLSDEAISLWCEILHLIPNSRMFIKNPSFSDPETVDRYLTLFASHGITRDRIDTEGQSPPEEMLAKYARVDIQLDSMPYSGGLTTLESLWMGVPVITLPGELFSSRHSLTHLINAGLPECVATSRNNYIEIACRLATDTKHLAVLRKTLRDVMTSSPVCDGFGFTENLQNAFRTMWHEWCSSRSVVKVQPCLVGKGTEVGIENCGDHIGYNEQGNRYSTQGNFELAIKYYLKAVDIKPGYIEAYYNLGIIYQKLHREEDACRMFRLVICLAPDFVDAYNALEQALKNVGQTEEARAVAVQRQDYLSETTG